MSPIPCSRDEEWDNRIREFADALKSNAFELGTHGLSQEEFYNSPLFRGAIEQIRGEFSATMKPKRDFVRNILNHLQDRGYIRDWDSNGSANRHDYDIVLASGKNATIELKGCLDGNNTTIFERPPRAQEFVIWSVCTNPSSDPKKNVWSGIHTRLGPHIIHNKTVVDGLIVWDWFCGSSSRPCPKLVKNRSRSCTLGQYRLPPPCLYLFPATIPSPRNNPCPTPQALKDVELLHAFHRCFDGEDSELNFVTYEVSQRENDTVRSTAISRNGEEARKSRQTVIKRTQ